jgi:hypothetical protein
LLAAQLLKAANATSAVADSSKRQNTFDRGELLFQLLPDA